MGIDRDERQKRLDHLRQRGIAIPARAYAHLDTDHAPPALQSWSWHAYVWDRPDRSRWSGFERDYDAAVAAWDRHRAFVDSQLEREAEREQAAADAEQERQTADADRRKQEAEELKARLRAQFLRLPGTTEAQFEKQFPEILADHQRRLMAGQDTDATRAAVRQVIRGAA